MTFMSELDAVVRAATSSVPSAERFQMSAVSSIVLLCSGELAFELLQKLSLLYATVVLPASACLLKMQLDLDVSQENHITKLQLVSLGSTSQEL